eukprot:CAMPEP_0202691696 /NCGR_PEP_ID=MMETSP1385-20130828/6337_1 /ASSEMBLY_ACC=CAM_ASM_000861 /TAXON_ID=933848 /ORGANISM="Elphidium margaritaceum" /LENGTH=418 /DNA_ID=CAMNT_0049347139 /DNA_START=75 /DNA_END=1331 /DNA_ORIENTATION=-
MARPKETTWTETPEGEADFLVVGDDAVFKDMMEPVLKEFGVQYEELDELIISLSANSITHLFNVVPQVWNILAEKKLYDEMLSFGKQLGIKPGGACECIAEQLMEDRSMLQRFCEFFAKRLPKQFDPNMGDDVTSEQVSRYVKKFQDKFSKLEEKVNPDAFQKSMDWVNRIHIVFSLISLAISWKFLWDSVWSIHNASKLMEEMRADLGKLREDEITPIFQFLGKVKKEGYLGRHHYEVYCEKIKSAIKTLEGWRKQIASEKERMQSKAVNNSISAVAMTISMFSTFGLNALNPSRALQAIGVLQGGTAALNVGVAVLSMSQYNRLNNLDVELRKEIQRLTQAQKDLATYVGQSVYDWDNAAVVEWVQAVHPATANVFAENNVDGADLLEMDDATMESMGLTLFHRKKLLRKIDELKR